MRRRRAAASLLSAGLAVAVAACGIPRDDQPHEISDRAVQDLVSPPSSTTTEPQDVPSARVSVYFLRDEALEEVRLPVQGEATLEAAIGLVLAGPTRTETEDGLTSFVPPGTKLTQATVEDGLAVIDLSSEINTVGGATEKAAYAQLVFTALSIRDVDRVRFEVDGKSLDAPTDQGSVTEVVASDYDPPLNPR